MPAQFSDRLSFPFPLPGRLFDRPVNRESGEEAPATVHAPKSLAAAFSKVPAVTLGFWIIKIAATTLGETGGDALSMTMNWGYLAGTALFLSLLVVLVTF